MAGGMVRVVSGDLDEIVEEMKQQDQIKVELAEQGIIVRGDAIGSLEALAFEAKSAELPIRKIDIGSVNRKDVVEASKFDDPLHRVIFAFNVKVNQDAEAELRATGVKVFANDVIYRLLDEYKLWTEERKREIVAEKRLEVVFPGKILLLRDHVFRVSKPAIVGVRVLAGRIRPGQALMKLDGTSVGRIKSIRTGEKTLTEAIMGAEVAVAIDDPTVGRQIDVEEVLLVDIPESHARELANFQLSADDQEAFDQIAAVKRKEKPFWGR
jgi:translation initiation factor 5B